MRVRSLCNVVGPAPTRSAMPAQARALGTSPHTAVVLFPGWFVERFDSKAAAWVLEPKALSSFIENQPERLTREEVQAMASALTSHIRTQIKL